HRRQRERLSGEQGKRSGAVLRNRKARNSALRFHREFSALFALLVCAASAGDAHGAGLYFSDRGVRPLARGGAFVAGADDLGAVWYNPAGLADAGTTLFAD